MNDNYMTNYQLIMTDVVDPATEAAIVKPLVEFNNKMAGPGNGKPIMIAIRDATGAVVGGLSGQTSRGWLFTHYLVVPDAARGQGLGTQIIKMAEREAIARGCIGAWLDTFEFQARGFYEKMGYSCFGEIQDYPPGFSRFFMKKTLVATQK